MPLQATSGAASYDGFGGGVAVEPVYIESIFSTYLYAGTNANITINNGIDLAGKGGLVWQKQRTSALPHRLFTTAMALGAELATNSTGQLSNSGNLTAYSSTGFTLFNALSDVGENYVTWTFRKQPKFFDVVTYTGDGAASRNISHALGSKPGFVVIKRTDSTGNWFVAAWRGNTFLVGTDALPFALNSTNGYNLQNGAAATSTTFDPNEVTISSNYGVTPSNANINSATYVAYLFAHDAGGFGLTGTDNVISCGSFTTDGSGNATVSLGYEPQWIMYKSASTSGGDWQIFDSMRGLTMGLDSNLSANSSGAETTSIDWLTPSATGFSTVGAVFYTSATYIYIAIRRGPMKVPTLGTSVYNGITRTGTGAATNITGAGFPIDLLIQHERATSNNIWTTDRLRGTLSNLDTQSTAAENTNSFFQFDKQDGFGLVGAGANVSGRTMIDWVFRRAPSVFDIVCYLGSGTTTVRSHNLTVAPELIIFKYINGAQGTGNWGVIHSITGTQFGKMFLNLNGASLGPYAYTDNQGLAAQPTTTTFTPSPTSSTFNTSANNYVAYLFATCAGVSKVGSYTGNGTTQTINCGFTGGARFVLIKRTDSTGDWYVWDSARGIVAGNDPYLLLNSTAAEVTSTDYVDTYSAGFEISSTAPAAINASGGTFIFLAIA
ncbi:hypothetical protein UFOVP662_56 [uncultured Caudovirales phage]|uniref:DUF7483 domain-containing protein n=1 Tax=uncultured Caudovirales phage TaxID=2100421 RepID=A0A6J5QL19_9CAUD|nr:hypothetical protein UFOVP662_56 [uncultured Caudovirales phage]CAB4181638.1 hypothetical protein UFOVP1067_56 [uncultured Caudovirales phage]